MPKHFISLKDFKRLEILKIVNRSLQLKKIVKAQPNGNMLLQNKTIGMIFTKSSTRTRISAETGWAYYGGHPLFLGKRDLQLGSGEPLSVTARVMSSMVDCILARVGGNEEIEELAKHSTVPVINALTARYHPLQILADLATIKEHFPSEKGLTVAWIGDSNNILNSKLVTYPRLGMNLNIATPKKYPVDSQILDLILQHPERNGQIYVTHDPVEAVHNADIIVTDTWISMGQESEKQQRIQDFKGFQVTEEMAKLGGAKPNWKFLHCLPRYSYEVDDQVFEGPRSLVFDEAENRKYTIMAVYEYLMLNEHFNMCAESAEDK